MLRLLHAGLVAAGLQLGAVIAITSLVILPALHGITFQGPPSTPRTSEAVWNYTSPLLIWSYLIVAVGIVFTSSKSTMSTAKQIRSTVRTRLDREQTMQLLVCLAIPAIFMASFALEQPPAFLVEVTGYFDCSAATSSIWGAAMSVASACLGATAHAVKKALDG
jgi:hypothetical protein